jgi:type IV pilus assembly protein PilE
MNPNPNPPGFTLIELMIAVAIVGILAAIAYPSYTEHIRSSRRADAQGALYGLQQAMERYYTLNSTYAGTANDAGAPAAAVGYAATVPVDGGTPTYDLLIDAGTSTYTLLARPREIQAADKCGTLTLTSTGVRGMTDAQSGLAASDCWRS